MCEATSDLAATLLEKPCAGCGGMGMIEERRTRNGSTQGIVNSRGLWLVRFAVVCSVSVSGGVFVCFCTNRRRLGLHVLNPQTRSLIRFGIYLYVSTWVTRMQIVV